MYAIHAISGRSVAYLISWRYQCTPIHVCIGMKIGRNRQFIANLPNAVASISTNGSTVFLSKLSQIAKFMGPTWGRPGSCRPQMGPMMAPWTLLSGAPTWLDSRGLWRCRVAVILAATILLGISLNHKSSILGRHMAVQFCTGNETYNRKIKFPLKLKFEWRLNVCKTDEIVLPTSTQTQIDVIKQRST